MGIKGEPVGFLKKEPKTFLTIYKKKLILFLSRENRVYLDFQVSAVYPAVQDRQDCQDYQEGTVVMEQT